MLMENWSGFSLKKMCEAISMTIQLKTLTLVTPQNRTIRIDRGNIDEQTAPTSAMPEMTKNLTVREIRDLVEYLSTLGKNDQP